MEHPAEDVVFRFLLGASSRQENRQIVRHLLARCPSCAKALRKALRKMRPEPPADPRAYDETLDRFAARLPKLAGYATPPRATPANLLSVL
jgi:hypothetical protein